ncbi:MAG: hypothetical protein Unbinned1068contig1001_9 [Prokaryotic dsDNA virus sp.]|nr:MAG: hypothetical protein Unbinned1068contig1001_9 [Prokaryotic dsDNA virus sp.]|tara:strand:- start:6064 stop:6363 length:300 start_codon:yes stop_codon:yes gene_type:complete
MSRIPCTECRKRKETEAALKALQSNHKKLQKKAAHRIHKIGDLEDTVKRLRASVAALRKAERRMQEKYEDVLDDRNELRRALSNIKKNVTAAMEESYLG